MTEEVNSISSWGEIQQGGSWLLWDSHLLESPETGVYLQSIGQGFGPSHPDGVSS